MIYGDKDIREKVFGLGVVENACEKQINPASLNIRLGSTFLKPKPCQMVQLGWEMEYERVEVTPGQVYTIKPGEFVLATTMEKITMPPNLAAFVHGRSSIGRIGLTVQNAGFIDPGFSGHITLELVNESTAELLLVPGYPVGQLVFFETTLVEQPYHGKYNEQVEATGSRMFLDGLNNRCVCCGELIPEGRQVCPSCDK